jgi:hypothetical protein
MVEKWCKAGTERYLYLDWELAATDVSASVTPCNNCPKTVRAWTADWYILALSKRRFDVWVEVRGA